jgi:hypothetical protein
VEVPERHDLAIQKIARGFDRDLEAVVEMHRARPFDLDTLVERFAHTWVPGAGSPGLEAELDASFHTALVTFYGDKQAAAGMKRVAVERASGPRKRR